MTKRFKKGEFDYKCGWGKHNINLYKLYSNKLPQRSVGRNLLLTTVFTFHNKGTGSIRTVYPFVKENHHGHYPDTG